MVLAKQNQTALECKHIAVPHISAI